MTDVANSLSLGSGTLIDCIYYSLLVGLTEDLEVGHFGVCIYYKAILFVSTGIPEKDLGKISCPSDEKQSVFPHSAVHSHCAIHPLTVLEG